MTSDTVKIDMVIQDCLNIDTIKYGFTTIQCNLYRRFSQSQVLEGFSQRGVSCLVKILTLKGIL